MSIFNRGTVVPTFPSNPAPSVPSSGGVIYGTDLYHYDDVNSWSEMKASGIEFAIMKASEGMGSDPKFAEYFNGAKAAGIIVSGYHFYNTKSDQKSQAQHFWDRLKSVGLEKTDISPIFDFEKSSGDFSSSDAANARVFMEEIARLSGRLPMIYLSDSTVSAIGNPSWLKAYPLWVARYGAEPKSKPWVFWQFSESSSIPGLGNKGDKNKFMGSVADLKEWISKT